MNIDYIKQALEKLSWNYSRSAKILGVSLSTLKRKIKQYDIQPNAPIQNEQG
jgi:DNA-binding NtrC family response regulator